MNIEEYKEKKLSLLDQYTELIIGAKTPQELTATYMWYCEMVRELNCGVFLKGLPNTSLS